eukprot:8000690-Alexandrium_andersonii.AAC.1
MGITPITHLEVLNVAKGPRVWQCVWEQQTLALGHVFRRAPGSPVRNLIMGRFLQPRGFLDRADLVFLGSVGAR